MNSTSNGQPPIAYRTEAQTVRFDLRDRIKGYATDNDYESSPSSHEVSPTDAYFDRPSIFAHTTFANQKANQQAPTRKSPLTRSHRHRQVQREPEKQQPEQENRLSVTNLQTSMRSSLARELIDRVVSNSETIRGDALTQLDSLYKELASIVAETNAEDKRILKLVETNHKQTIKPPSDTRINDTRNAGGIQVGERVALAKDRIDTAEAEVAAMWGQWESAQNEVDSILAELASAQDAKEAQTGPMADVQMSLAREMAKFGEELTGLLEDAHEEARASERASSFAKKINGVMSALLQQYLLED